MRLYTVLLYFLQTALHVSDDTLTHHQENAEVEDSERRSESSTSADGSNYGSTSTRYCNYSLSELLMMEEGIIRNM